MMTRALILIFIFSVSIYSQWNKINTAGNIPHFKNHSAVYHPPSNSMIIFGGRNAAGEPTDKMWKLDLNTNTWSEIPPRNVQPFSRYSHNAHYDSAGNRMIIWSGQGAGQSLFNDVWAFKFADSLWINLWPDGNTAGVPNKRYGTASVFDPVSRQVVTFAGFTTTGRFEDTWTFNVDNMMWQDRTSGFHPPKRCLHAGVFARDMRKMVMYAGQHDNGFYDDIWTLNIDNYSWQSVTPPVRPGGRFWNSTIYSGNGSIIIFGGLGSQAYNDMWKFSLNNNQWEVISQGSAVPGRRWGHSGIYIQAQDRMIIFGGEGDSLYSDTWQYSNVSAIGIQQAGQNIPKQFSLGQNYPNPFNPVTNITFDVPKAGYVKLAVYDALGREVIMLVNGILQPGKYNADWDASAYPSGIYFYRLEAGDFTRTKKMSLVK